MANYRLAHLCRRGDVLYFRMVVPRSLVQRVGKREFKLSLKTVDQTIARQRCTGLETAKRGSFRLLPIKAMIDPLRRDYEAMATMIFGEVPSFEAVLESIARAEERLNAA